VDRLLFPENGPSVDHLVPEWQELKVGDRVLDGAPQKKCAFVVAAVEPDRHLVLRSREHLPPEWVDRFGASIDWSWAFVLDRLPGDRTRLIFRSRFHLEPRGVEAFNVGVIIPADFVKGRQMLRGVREPAESTTEADLAMVARGERARAFASDRA
jgi:hypothetical protein